MLSVKYTLTTFYRDIELSELLKKKRDSNLLKDDYVITMLELNPIGIRRECGGQGQYIFILFQLALLRCP